ncbi:hypothetical protein ISS03_00725 [Patescibacteria group bacterium]|nr:hypothetical protein [Patescibacteria group bacterium]
MRKLRKTFISGVMFTTIFALSGIAAVSPAQAAASAGDLIKMDGLDTVYYLGADGKRYVFPNAQTYFSWYPDFSSVVTVPQSELESYRLGSNVTMRAGTKLVKITTDPMVYAVEPGGNLRSIVSEANAIALYGADWAKRVIDVPDSFFTNYKVLADLAVGKYPAGQLVKSGDATYYFDGTDYRAVASDAAMSANRFQASNVVTTTMAITAGGTALAGAEATLIDTSASGATTGITPGVGTGATVSVASDTPYSSTIPSSSARVTFTKFNIAAASDGDVTVNEITVRRTGVGAYNELSRVYLYDGMTRLSNGRTINSDSHSTTFSGLGLKVAAGTVKTITIAADTASGSAGNHSLGINAASDIKTNGASVSGSFPVKGNTMSLSSVTAGTVVLAGNGTLSNPTIGDANVSVAQFKLTAASEDLMFGDITLKQDGTIDTSLLSNFTLMQGTTNIPVTTTINGRNVMVKLDTPFKLVDGSGKIFTLKANVSSDTEVGKTIVFYVNNVADVNTQSINYGVGVTATITAYDAAGDSQTLTLQGGGITISNLSSPSSDVKVNSTEVELTRVAVKASSDSAEIQKMTLRIATTKATSGGDDYGTFRDMADDADYDSGTDTLLLKNIKLKDADTGATIGSAKAITDADNFSAANDVDASLDFVFDDYFTIAKGATRNIIAVADIDTTQISSVVYATTMQFGSSDFTAKDSQDNTISDVVPATDIAGYNRTTRTSSLTISRASSPETRTVVKGSSVDALGIIFATGSGTGNDVKLSGLTLDIFVDADTTLASDFALNTATGDADGDTTTILANALVQDVSLYVGADKIAGPVSVDTNGRAIFTSSKFVNGYYNLPAGASKTVVVRATASGNAPYGAADDRFAFTFDAADVTAEDSEGSVTPTVTGTDLNGLATPGVYVQVTGNGTITVAADSGKPASSVVIAGRSTEQELTRVLLSTTKEDFLVDEITFAVNEAGSYDDVEYLRLYDTSGNALSENVGLNASGLANFTGLTISVPKLDNKVLVVKGKIKAVGERTTATDGTAGTGADTGDGITINIDTTAGNFNATGAASGIVDTTADAAVANTMVVRKSLPTVVMQSLPSTTLANASKTISKFSITADANGDIVFKGVQPITTLGGASAITAGSVYMYDVTGSNETLLNAVGVNASALIEIDNASIVTIAAGTTRTFEIRATITGSAAGDSVETQLVKDSAALSSTTETAADAVADAANNFIWSDKSADTNAVTSTEWTNSYVFPSWPTTISVLSR